MEAGHVRWSTGGVLLFDGKGPPDLSDMIDGASASVHARLLES